jgi:hypothetical protein
MCIFSWGGGPQNFLERVDISAGCPQRGLPLLWSICGEQEHEWGMSCLLAETVAGLGVEEDCFYSCASGVTVRMVCPGGSSPSFVLDAKLTMS